VASGKRRRTLFGAAVFAAGAIAGAALEELLFRRVLGRPDEEGAEPIGSLHGEPLRVRTFDGTEIYAEAFGPPDAPLTLVLAHGAIESRWLWHYQLRDLSADGRLRLLAYDARGHGLSGPARGPEGTTPMTPYTMARDLVAVARELTRGSLVLIGHSMGGMTVQALWQHGDIRQMDGRVAGVVLINTTYTSDLRGWRGRGGLHERAIERVEDVLQRVPRPPRIVDRLRPGRNDLTLLIARLVYGRDPSPRHVEASVRMYERTPTPTIAALVDIAGFDAHGALPLIDVPVLILAGERDLVTPPLLSETIAARVPDAELVVLDGCGHIGPFERHEEVTAHLRKFAERVS
jgi:pimeloyl-ACP methyl ester carboxylesterase